MGWSRSRSRTPALPPEKQSSPPRPPNYPLRRKVQATLDEMTRNIQELDSGVVQAADSYLTITIGLPTLTFTP
jgi:hypothetical protein